jgi:hypothetical protein
VAVDPAILYATWDLDDLLFIKVGTGIGCGIVAGGHIHRGAQGAAGDLGHVQLTEHPEALCRCGNLGCVEAVGPPGGRGPPAGPKRGHNTPPPPPRGARAGPGPAPPPGGGRPTSSAG